MKDTLNVRFIIRSLVLGRLISLKKSFFSKKKKQTKTYWQAYHQLEEIATDTKKLTRENICVIHNYLMRNNQVSLNLDFYVSPGSTRTLTRKSLVQTLINLGVAKIQSCPYPAVDEELDYICKMGAVSNLRFNIPNPS